MSNGLEQLAQSRCRVGGRQALFECGDAFSALYVVRAGFFKTNAFEAGGREQVTGFFMPGDLLGLDGFGSGCYRLTATALEDSVVGVAPRALIEQRCPEIPGLQREIDMALSRQIAGEQHLLLLLGSLHAEERVAAFLLNLSRRFARRGYSPSDFRLRMTRSEIGSYLGLTLETVSRLLSRFQRDGLIVLRQRHVQLTDRARLEALAGFAQAAGATARCAARGRFDEDQPATRRRGR